MCIKSRSPSTAKTFENSLASAWARQLRRVALGIARNALTVVDTRLKSGGLAEISGVSLEVACGGAKRRDRAHQTATNVYAREC